MVRSVLIAGVPVLRQLPVACLVATAVACVGCATVEKYDVSLNALIGVSQDDLLQRWGRPSRSYDSGGLHYLVYATSGTAYLSGTATSYQPTSRATQMHDSAVGGSPDFPIELACVTTFELSNARVVSWSHSGNYCKSR